MSVALVYHKKNKKIQEELIKESLPPPLFFFFLVYFFRHFFYFSFPLLVFFPVFIDCGSIVPLFWFLKLLITSCSAGIAYVYVVNLKQTQCNSVSYSTIERVQMTWKYIVFQGLKILTYCHNLRDVWYLFTSSYLTMCMNFSTDLFYFPTDFTNIYFLTKITLGLLVDYHNLCLI